MGESFPVSLPVNWWRVVRVGGLSEHIFVRKELAPAVTTYGGRCSRLTDSKTGRGGRTRPPASPSSLLSVRFGITLRCSEQSVPMCSKLTSFRSTKLNQPMSLQHVQHLFDPDLLT